MSAAFTPGPWWVPPGSDMSGVTIPINSNPHNIALAHYINGQANANLIAAAPELYEACQALLDAYTGNWIECEEAVGKARAALAKARGGA